MKKEDAKKKVAYHKKKVKFYKKKLEQAEFQEDRIGFRFKGE